MDLSADRATFLQNPHLDGEAFFWPGGPVGVLLCHGFTATTAEVRPLAHTLHAAGFTVAGPLLPGHGTNPDDLNHVRWEHWASAFEETYTQLAANCTHIFVGGESAGGLLALHSAASHPQVVGILTYAPALRLPLGFWGRVRLNIAGRFIPYVPKENLDDGTPWQGYKVNPLRGVLQLIKLQRVVSTELEQITQPLLVVQGRLDKTVDLQVPQMLVTATQSRDIEIHWMAKSGHVVIIDQEMDEVAQITLSFIERVLAAIPV